MGVRRLFLGSLLLLAAVAPSATIEAQADSAAAAGDPAKAEAIRTLLHVTKTAELFLAAFEEAAASQPLPADVPADFWDAFKAKVRAQVPEFVEMLIPIYGAQLSLDDVNALIRFYQSPLGERFVEAQPALMNETMKLGERWAMRIVGEVFMELSTKPR